MQQGFTDSFRPVRGAAGATAGTGGERHMKSRLGAVAGYGAAVGLCGVIVAWMLKLWTAHLTTPMTYFGDALLIQTLIKSMIENGWYLHNPTLGAPFGLEMHDFPLDDSLYFLMLKFLCLFSSDSAVVFNLYYLLTYPLVTLSALFVFRRFGVAYGPALVGSILFAFVPYHLVRGQHHLFLSSYFLVPLLVLVALWLYLDGGVVFRREGAEGGWRWNVWSRRTLGSLAVCALMGCGGVYYAFFGCFFLLLAAVACCLNRRRLYPLVSGGILIAVICLGVAANLTPKYLYDREHGPNPQAIERTPAQAELLGMKVAQLVLPVPEHRVRFLANVREKYRVYLEPAFNENCFASLGLVGSLGFVFLLSRLLLRTPAAEPRPQDGLTLFNVFGVLLATVGGFGSVFSLLVSTWIRAYNRMSIFIAFFALFAVVLVLDRVGRRVASARGRLCFHGCLAVLLVGGVLDEIPRIKQLDVTHARAQEHYQGDAEFVRRIESALPPGAMVFQLPSIDFPENPLRWGMASYDHFRVYLHSHQLRWSHGMMQGREGDAWRRLTIEKPLPDLLRTLAYAGFQGVCVERNGFADSGREMEADLTRLLGVQPFSNGRLNLSFFDLTDFAARTRRAQTADRWAALQEEALHPVRLTWLWGVWPTETQGKDSYQWAGDHVEFRLTNPLPRPRNVTVVVDCATAHPEAAHLRIDTPAGSAEWTIDGHGRSVEHGFALPPGEHVIKLSCDGAKQDPHLDWRTPVFRLRNFNLKDLDDGEAAAGESPTPGAGVPCGSR
jgi:phosphoglycerol transferase